VISVDRRQRPGIAAGDLPGIVRPWHLAALRSRTEHLGDVTSARVVSVDADAVVAELLPDGGRSILAEQVKNEIFDGATPYTTYVRGVIVDGDRVVLLTGRDDSALITEG
jgi:hypothetical protein